MKEIGWWTLESGVWWWVSCSVQEGKAEKWARSLFIRKGTKVDPENQNTDTRTQRQAVGNPSFLLARSLTLWCLFAKWNGEISSQNIKANCGQSALGIKREGQ